MAKHQELDLVRAVATPTNKDQLKHATQRPVDQGHHHAEHLGVPRGSPQAARLVPPGIVFSAPCA
jgi:hypothetical protein